MCSRATRHIVSSNFLALHFCYNFFKTLTTHYDFLKTRKHSHVHPLYDVTMNHHTIYRFKIFFENFVSMWFAAANENMTALTGSHPFLSSTGRHHSEAAQWVINTRGLAQTTDNIRKLAQL